MGIGTVNTPVMMQREQGTDDRRLTFTSVRFGVALFSDFMAKGCTGRTLNFMQLVRSWPEELGDVATG